MNILWVNMAEDFAIPKTWNSQGKVALVKLEKSQNIAPGTKYFGLSYVQAALVIVSWNGTDAA